MKVKLNSGQVFQANAGMSFVQAAKSAGLTLPHSCSTGRCSTCKCKVLSGETQALFPELGLSDQEKSDGWILSCVRSALSDVVLSAEDLSAYGVPDQVTLPCRIAALDLVEKDVLVVRLRFPPNKQLTYLAGQYVDVVGPTGARRSYSLANQMAESGQVELHIKRVQGGELSGYWFDQAKAGDLLRLQGPKGTFFLRDIADKHLILLATGTGIAPIKAILEKLRNDPGFSRPRRTSLLWGVRHADEHYLQAADLAGFDDYVPVVSRPDEHWSGSSGHVQDEACKMFGDFSGAAVYACGSPNMIQDARTLLLENGLDDSRFHADAFVSSI